MRTIKKYLLGLIFITAAVNFCQSQKNPYEDKIRPKVKAKLDSLYPKAKYPNAISKVVLNDKYVSDTTQEIDLACHCKETDGTIILVFDTNGNFLNKDIHYIPVKNLPDGIISYMKKNASPTVKFLNDMIKSINNKGEMTYSIIDQETPNQWTLKEFSLKFKPSGELISKELVPGGTL